MPNAMLALTADEKVSAGTNFMVLWFLRGDLQLQRRLRRNGFQMRISDNKFPAAKPTITEPVPSMKLSSQ